MLLFRRVQPTLTGIANTVSGPVRSGFASANEQMRLQQSLAAASGVTLSRYGAAWAALQARVGFLGTMTAAFRSANGAGSTFTGTLNGVGRAAGSGLRSALGGVTNALGGPFGVVMAGVSVGLGLLAARQQKAAQAAAEHQQRISTLTSALRESGGQIDSNVRNQAAQALLDTKTGQGQLTKVMEQAGVPLASLTDAYLGQGTSLDALQKQLLTTANAHREYRDQAGGKASVLDYTDVDVGQQYKDAADALGSVKGEMAESVKNARDLAAATKGAGDGTSAYDRLKAAVGGLADQTADADTRTRSLKSALDLLSGGQISLQAAEAKVNSAVLDLQEGRKGVNRGQGYGGRQLVNEDKTLNTTTRNGQQLYTQLTALSDAAADASVATFDLAQRNGETLPAALAKAREQMSRARTEAIAAARGYGLTKTQAEGVADTLGLLPSKVSLLLQTKGMDSTLANLIAVQAEFQRLPNAKTIKVDSLSDGAQQKLRDLGFTVKTVPGTRQIRITAPTQGAKKNLDTLIETLGRTPNSKNIPVSAPTAAAVKSLQAVQTKLRATPGAKSVIVRAPTAQARKHDLKPLASGSRRFLARRTSRSPFRPPGRARRRTRSSGASTHCAARNSRSPPGTSPSSTSSANSPEAPPTRSRSRPRTCARTPTGMPTAPWSTTSPTAASLAVHAVNSTSRRSHRPGVGVSGVSPRPGARPMCHSGLRSASAARPSWRPWSTGSADRSTGSPTEVSAARAVATTTRCSPTPSSRPAVPRRSRASCAPSTSVPAATRPAPGWSTPERAAASRSSSYANSSL